MGEIKKADSEENREEVQSVGFSGRTDFHCTSAPGSSELLLCSTNQLCLRAGRCERAHREAGWLHSCAHVHRAGLQFWLDPDQDSVACRTQELSPSA